MRLQKWRRFAGKDRQPLDEPSARGDRISDQGGRDKVERMQQTKLIISPERADFWLLGPFLISSVSQSIIIILLAAKWSRKMQWPGNGRVPASFLGLGELLRPDMGQGTCNGACSQMRHGMCVRRQLIWRRPELGPRPCRSLPLQKRDRERRASSRRPLGAGGEFSSARGCQ